MDTLTADQQTPVKSFLSNWKHIFPTMLIGRDVQILLNMKMSGKSRSLESATKPKERKKMAHSVLLSVYER